MKIGTYYGIMKKGFDIFGTCKEQRKEALRELNRKANAFYGTEGIRYVRGEESVIFWYGENDEKLFRKYGHSTDTLLHYFCEEINTVVEGDVTGGLYYILIDSPLSLADEGETEVFPILERLLYIWETTGIVPVLLEDNFLSTVIVKSGVPSGKTYDSEDIVERMTELANDYAMEYDAAQRVMAEDGYYFEKFFTSIKRLISLFGKGGMELPGNTFMHEYMMYEMGKYKETDICGKLQIETKKWYRDARKYMESPLYEEYANAFRSRLRNTPRKRKLEEPIKLLADYKRFHDDFFYNKYIYESKLTPEGYEEMKPEYRLYAKYDDIHALVDVRRAYLRAKETCSNYIHKGKLDEKLAEAGVTMEDLPDINKY